MQDIKEIARAAIVAEIGLPEKDIVIDSFDYDWKGLPKIYIITEPTVPEDESQMGIVAYTTVMQIHCVAEDRDEADEFARVAVSAAYTEFERLERARRSGIYCVTYSSHFVGQIKDRSEFQATWNIRIMHR
jgi:hypothetical protein